MNIGTEKLIDEFILGAEWDVDAGDPALDFINTVEWRNSPNPEDHLASFSDVVSWGIAAEMISAENGALMLDFASRYPKKAKQSYQKIIRLRGALSGLISSVALDKAFGNEDLDVLNATILEANRASKLESTADGIRWGWAINEDHLDLILWSVALQATTLLTSEKIYRVGECEDDRGCGYLFLDESKNQSRRWCTMESCGNRAKARRHYLRQAQKRAVEDKAV